MTGELGAAAQLLVDAERFLRLSFALEELRELEVGFSVAGVEGVVVRVIEVPRMSPSDLKEAMRYEVERSIPFAITDVEMDYQAIDDGPVTDATNPNMEVLFAAAQRGMINSQLAMYQAAGLDVKAIDIEPLAIGRSLIDMSRKGLGNKNVVVVNVGMTRPRVDNVATVASAAPAPSALKDTTDPRRVPTRIDRPTIPLHVRITAAYTVSRARVSAEPAPLSISVTISTKPAVCMATTNRSFAGRPRIHSYARNTMCPPSRSGIGKKLITAKFALSIVRKINKEDTPSAAE